MAGPVDVLAGLGTLDDLAVPRDRPLVHRAGTGPNAMPAAALNGDAMPNTAPAPTQPLISVSPTVAAPAPTGPVFAAEIAALSSGQIPAADPSRPALVTPAQAAPGASPSLGHAAGSGQNGTGPAGDPSGQLGPFLETLLVPTENATGITSHTVLQRGVTYTLYAWGDFQYGPTTADRGDAQYRKFTSPTPYAGDGLSHIGVALSGVMVLGSYPTWGGYSAQHRYALKVQGLGGPLHAFYLDTPAGYSTHHGSLGLALDPPNAIICRPPNTPPVQCCGQNGDLSQTATGAGGGYDASREYGDGGIRYFDGEINQESDLLSSDGFGTDWGVSLTDANWSQAPRCLAPTPNLGTGVSDSQQPYVINASPDPMSDPPTTVAVATSSTDVHYFDLNGTTYQARGFPLEHLTLASGTFLYKTPTGETLQFNDFHHQQQSALPPGLFVGKTDKAGHQTDATYDANGILQRVSRTAPDGGSDTVTETYAFSYNSDGTVSQIAVNRHTDSNPDTTIRQVVFTYYDGSQVGGNAGDLMLAQVQEPNGQGMMSTFDTYYYRYDTDINHSTYGYLQYVFKPPSYDRLVHNLGDPTQLTDSQVRPYADYFYDRSSTPFQVTVQGAGCSSCTGGRGTFSYQFMQNGSTSYADGYNNWKYETVEGLPDGSTRTVFANFQGETMLSVFQSGGQTWETFYKYDTDGTSADGYGRTLWVAQPSRVWGMTRTAST